MDTMIPELGEVITSKGMVLILLSDWRPVRMNQPINDELFVIGATAPVYNGAPGRVYLKGIHHRRKSEVRPDEIGMVWA